MLVLYSPGGSVIAGNQFIEFVKGLPCKVHTVPIFAASMAYIITQSLQNRYALPTSILMSHRGYLKISGELPGELLQKLDLFMKMLQYTDEQVAKRLGISVKVYQRLIRDELWLMGFDAVKKNHADKLVSARCGKSLNGTYVETMHTFFGPVDVTFSKCPLITDPLKIERSGRTSEEAYKEIFDMFSRMKNVK